MENTVCNDNISNDKTKMPKTVFKASDTAFAWLSILFGYLFFRVFPSDINPFGGFLFILFLFSVTSAVLKIKKIKIYKYALIAAVSAILISFSLLLTSNAVINNVAYFYSIISYLYFVYAAFGNSVEKGFSNFITADIFKAAFVLPFCSVAKSVGALFPPKFKNGKKTALKILIGIAVAVIPTTVIFFLLSYDSEFIRIISDIFDFGWDEILSHIGSLIVGIPIGMYIFGLFYSSENEKCSDIITKDECKELCSTLRLASPLTVSVSVLPVIFLYIIFFISQWQYYMSAFSGVLPENISYAQYAREGFFQLCTVCSINLVILAAASVIIRKKEEKTPVSFKIISVVISVMTLILSGTAISKMILYIDTYGLTPKRVYATWFIITLSILFVLIIIKQFSHKLQLIAVSAAVFIIMFLGLSFSGVDGLIAKYNVDRYIDGTLESVDIYSMKSLGYSAVPELVRLTEALDEKNGTDISDFDGTDGSYDKDYYDVVRYLYEFSDSFEEKGVFSFSFPLMKAKSSLEKIIE